MKPIGESNELDCLRLLVAGLVGVNPVTGVPVYSFPFPPLTPPAVTQLIFHVQPGGAVVNVPFTQQPVIWAADSGGNPVASFTGQISIEVFSGIGTLSGTTTISCVAGVASFTDLALDATGNFVLRGFKPDLSLHVDSASFTVTAPASGFTLLANTSKAGGLTTVTTDAIDTRGANLIVVAIAQNNPVTGTLTDSAGNIGWTELTQSVQASVITSFFYFYNPTTSAAHTFTFAGSLVAASIAVVALSGSASSPVDQQNGSTVGASSTIQAGSITPVQDAELILFVNGGNNPSGTPTVDSGFTRLETQFFGGGSHYAIDLCILVPGAITAYNPTLTYSGATFSAARIASFKHA